MRAADLVDSIIETVSQEHTFEYNRITIRNQRTRWGSCSSKKNLNFNYRIIFLRPELAKYLVVHELCHLVHMNHSRSYWSLVASLVSRYKKLQRELKKMNVNII